MPDYGISTYSSKTQLLLAFYLRDICNPILKTLEQAKVVLAHQLFQIQCSKFLANCQFFVARLCK